jgi:hypothetical protein
MTIIMETNIIKKDKRKILCVRYYLEKNRKTINFHQIALNFRRTITFYLSKI